MPHERKLSLQEHEYLDYSSFYRETSPDEAQHLDQADLNASNRVGDLENNLNAIEEERLLEKPIQRKIKRKKKSEFKKLKMNSEINSNKSRFFLLASKFKGVCLARCSPSMKSLVTQILCNKLHKQVLTIGDGGNDVGMIQISSIGIGIFGKEGNQAALAADMSITQFKWVSTGLWLFR